MKEPLHEFVGLLRKSGIRVSPSETLDCLRGLDHVELLDKEEFRVLLETTLIKNRQDHDAFNSLFRLYFEKHQPPSSPEESSQDVMDLALKLIESGEFSQLFRKFMQEGMEGIIPFLLKTENLTAMNGMNNPMAAFSTMMLRGKIDREKWVMQLDQLLELLKENGISRDELDKFREMIDERINFMRTMIEDFVEVEKKRRSALLRKKPPDEELMNKRFASLSSHDIEAMRKIVHEMIKRMKDEYAFRQRRQRHTKIDIKRTLRKSQKYGGVPVEIFMKKHRKSKGRIVTLCDVSNSVKNASDFMLNLLYALQDQFARVRSFVFVEKLGEVTEFFDKYDVNKAIYEALNNANITYLSCTDYGNVLRQFHREYLDAVNSKTTVIIIGDGRSNFLNPEEWALEKIRAKARRIFWLNPEDRYRWDTGDSIIHCYKRYCNEVRECRNLSQLMDFVDKLVL